MSVIGTMRFLVGAGLVAAGASLAAPLAARLTAATRAPAPVAPAGQVPAGGMVAPRGSSPAARPPVLASADPGLVPDGGLAPPPAGSGADGADWLQLDRSPPPPPAPLPPAPVELARPNPAMGAAYRSTLEVPPPALLDAAAPPPATAWPVVSASTPVSAAVALPAAAPVVELTVPATYRVRDGDDLGSIAGRFYGHPAAASAIWAANREMIPHPELLPIGAELRLPPPWSVRIQGRGATGGIEPAAHVRPPARGRAGDPASVAAAAAVPPPWLAPVPVVPGAELPQPVTAPRR